MAISHEGVEAGDKICTNSVCENASSIDPTAEVVQLIEIVKEVRDREGLRFARRVTFSETKTLNTFEEMRVF